MLPIGQMAIVSMMSHVIFIYLTWRVLIGIDFERILRKGYETEARLFIFFVAIFVGRGVSGFFLDILQWSQDLIYLFG